MTEREARAVVAALESGQQFTFSSYSADTREVLESDRAAGRFVYRRQHAYNPDTDEREELTRDQLVALLVERFSFRSFGLPSVGRAVGPGKR
jgi:hypothetical protein